jgi:Aspartyl protease
MLKAGAAAVAALLLAVAPSAAAEYSSAGITVSQLFERNRHALGSFDAGSYRFVTRSISQNGDVWTAETLWNDDGRRTTLREGDFSWSYGEYRGRRWHQSANGLVLPSSSFTEENDPFATALSHAGNPASGVTLVGITGDASPAFVVDVTPNGGLQERRYYDAHTYLLSRVELTDYDGHKQVWSFSDYRRTAGRLVANAIAYESDGSAVTERTNVVSYERISSSSIDLTVPASKLLFDLGGRDAVAVPARFTDGGIVVPVTIGNRGLDFLLDSGSSDLLIDAGVARELGMASTGAERVSFAGDYVLANARAPDFSVAGLTAKNVAFLTARLQEDLPGQRIVGLLGTDFIASGALKVDFEKQTLTLYSSLPAGLATQGWSDLPLTMDSSVPMISGAFSGRPGHFIADLGADYSTLYPHYFAQFPIEIPRGAADQDQYETLGGRPFGVKYFTMNRLVLGDWIFGDVQVAVPSASYAQERGYDGLIGRNTLSSFNLIFDYKDGELWFKPIDFGNK